MTHALLAIAVGLAVGAPPEFTANCTPGKCACAPTSTLCNGGCTDLTTDPQHCGNCVRAGSPGQSCVNGTCQ